MDDRALIRICGTREQAHAAVKDCYAYAQAMISIGKRVKLSIDEAHDPISLKQRRFLHGPVLTQIAEQVRLPDGTRYVASIWKEFFRALFLEAKPVYEMRRLPKWDALTGELVQQKRATPHRVRQSTEDLSIKGYSEYIDRVLAHAATEFGVEFRFDLDEREAVRYRPPVRRVKQEAVPA